MHGLLQKAFLHCNRVAILVNRIHVIGVLSKDIPKDTAIKCLVCECGPKSVY